MLPNFIIGAVQKGGTSWMCRTLKRHPQIYMSEKKELEFFWKDSLYASGFDWYGEHFRDAGGPRHWVRLLLLTCTAKLLLNALPGRCPT